MQSRQQARGFGNYLSSEDRSPTAQGERQLVPELGTGVPRNGLTSRNALPPALPHQTKAGGACAGAACHSSAPLFPHSYSLEFLSSVCFVSDLNEQEEKGRSLDKSDQGVDMLRLPPAGMPSPTLMRGREREVATENSGPKETLDVKDRGKRRC